jgi:hypothetical protein
MAVVNSFRLRNRSLRIDLARNVEIPQLSRPRPEDIPQDYRRALMEWLKSAGDYREEA